MELKRFLKGGLKLSLIGFVDRAAGVLLGVVLARWLGPDGYGAYAFVMAIVGILTIFACFGTPALLIREVAAAVVDNKQKDIRKILSKNLHVMVFTSSSIILISCGVLYILGYLDVWNQRIEYALAAALLLSLVLLAFLGGALRGLGQVVLSVFLATLLPVICMLLLLGFGFLANSEYFGTSNYALAARLASTCLAIIIFAMVLNRRMSQIAPGGIAGKHRDYIREAAPFMLIGATAILMERSDIVMLGLFLDDATVGIYKVGVEGAFVVAFFFQKSYTITQPEFAKSYAKGDFRTLESIALMSARITMVLTLVVALLLVIFGEELIVLIFGEVFRNAYVPLLILVIGRVGAILFGAPGYILSMSGRQSDVVRVNAITVVANIILNLALIPFYGIVGAAIATGLCLSVNSAILMVLVRRRLHINCAPILPAKLGGRKRKTALQGHY